LFLIIYEATCFDYTMKVISGFLNNSLKIIKDIKRIIQKTLVQK